MKIIQSYAHFDEGSPYLSRTDNNKKLLNFYSFLLSYLTLKKYYGYVTMYCDKKGFNTLVKYIPYDNVIIKENNNSFKFWSYYKVDVIKEMKEDFIHVDSDVFIFDDLFAPFIFSNEYDVIVQDKIPKELNISNTYVTSYRKYLINNNIFNPNLYDGKCFSCGTLGVKMGSKNKYVLIADEIKNGFVENKTNIVEYVGMICEELALYLTALKHNLRVYEILDHDDIINLGHAKAGNLKKYTHMYLSTKYNVEYVKLIKNKIYKEFPEHIKTVERYELDVIKKYKFFRELV